MATEAGHIANRSYMGHDGAFHLNGAAFYGDAETDISGQLETVVGGVAAGTKVVGGTIALDGSNPTAITTGLTTVTGFSATLQGAVAPGLGTSILTHAISSGTVNVYAWKVTGAGDATLIESTGTETISWTATGT